MPDPANTPRAKRRSRGALFAAGWLVASVALGTMTTYAVAWWAVWRVRDAVSENVAVADSFRIPDSKHKCQDGSRALNWGAMDASLIVHGEFRSFIEQERQRVQRLSVQERSTGASVDPSTTKPHEASEPPEFTVVPEALWRQLRGNMIFNEAWHHAELSDLSAHIRAASLGTAMCTFDGRRLFVQWTECGWPRTCLRSVHLRLSSLQVSDPASPKTGDSNPPPTPSPSNSPSNPSGPACSRTSRASPPLGSPFSSPPAASSRTPSASAAPATTAAPPAATPSQE